MPATISGVCYLAGVVILMLTDNVVIVLVGLFILATGGGASFAWVVAMIAVVSKDGKEAAKLSGMSQSVGYVMAAIVPTLAGFLFELTGGWTSVMVLLMGTSLIVIFSIATGKELSRTKDGCNGYIVI